MTRTRSALTFLLATASACSAAPDASLSPLAPPTSQLAAAPGGTKYKLRFITGVTPAGDGEIQSGWFPDAGLTLNTRSPWKSVSASGTISLVNFTHGDWTTAACASFFNNTYTVNVTTWDIAGTSPTLSFAGGWYGNLAISQTKGTSVAFDGDRVLGGVVTPAAGGIHNVVTNGNAAIETRDPSGNNDWFRLEVRNAGMKFGSAASPDGVTIVTGAEVACANFTIEARKTTLIAP